MTDTDTTRRGTRKLTPGKIQSEQRDTLTLGLTAGGGRRVEVGVPQGVNLLAVGHGVPHTARLLESVIAHNRTFRVPIYGIDLFPMLSDFSPRLFAAKPAQTANGGVKLIRELIEAGQPVALIVTRADVALRAEYAAGVVGPFAQALLDAAATGHISLFVTCYESAKAADLPDNVLAAFGVRIALGKLFLTESERIFDEREIRWMQEASHRHSVLVGGGVFQHDHPTFTEDYQVTTPGAARYL